MKNIVILSTDDVGGAGKAAFRLMLAINNAGHNCKMLVKNRQSDNDKVISIPISDKLPLKQRLINKYKNIVVKNLKLDDKYYYFGYKYDYVNINDVKKVVKLTPDIIIVTWISGFISPAVIGKYASSIGAKIVLYPMDMSLFTGGCHYAWSCQGYMDKCNSCPAILNDHLKFIASDELHEKKKSWGDVEYWACSTQIENELKKSSLKGDNEIHKMYIPIDENVFNFNSRESAKDAFGIKREDFVLLFGSKVSREHRKGLNILIEALKVLKLKRLYSNVKIIIAGIKSDQVEEYGIPYEVVDIDFIKDDNVLSLLYQASDLLVSPSIQDSGPMMVNEAQMCGLPVVSFSVGVAIDFLSDNDGGAIASQFTADELAKSIAHCIDNRDLMDRQLIADRANKKTSFSAFSKALEKIW